MPASTSSPTTPGTIGEQVDAVLAAIRRYQPGGSRGALLISDQALSEATADPGFRGALEDGLKKLLSEDLNASAKEHVCRQLGVLGSEACCPVLVGLMHDPSLRTAASQALDAIRGQTVDDALRKALPGSRGQGRLGLIDLLGRRRHPRSVKLLAELMADEDPATAASAMAALGSIGTAPAADALRRTGPIRGRESVALYVDACLVCASRLEAGSRARRLLLAKVRDLDLAPYLAIAVDRALKAS